MSVAGDRPPKKKWSLWRAALYGLIVSVIVLVINIISAGGALWPHVRSGNEMIGYAAGRLFFLPLVFVLVAVIRNSFVKTPRS